MKIYLIRHGKTKGNLEKRYVGRTNEGLCRQTIEEYRKRPMPKADRIYASPMKRCVQTAQIFYPKQYIHLVEEFRECDFGDFEYKNYQELKENADYQRFIDTNGEWGFPGGEQTKDFKERCQRAFYEVVLHCKTIETVAFVVHGGTIMSIMEKFARPCKDYYDWQIGNGEGYVAEAVWEKNQTLILKNVEKIMLRT